MDPLARPDIPTRWRSQGPPAWTHPGSRRRFLISTATATAGVAVVPAAVLGRGGEVAPNSRLNVAFVGVGSQGLRVMLEFLKHPDVQGVAVSDPVSRDAHYPQWGQNEFCNAVHRLLDVRSGWEWLSPNTPVLTLTPALRVPAGTAGRDPAREIIDAWNAKRNGQTRSRGCTAYADPRELLTKEEDVDAVVVGTPDHLHAPIALAAMKARKHVFCQKPMAHSLEAARRMANVARESGVATQVAVGTQATEETKQLCEWIAAGAVGQVHEVVNWSNRPFWPQGIPRPEDAPPTPPFLDWDLWLGPAPARPYHPAYLHFVWRGWHDFGCGALGDMGCYSLDIIFRALHLTAPVRAEASSSERFPDTFPKASIVHLRFPARGDLPPVTLTWFDGGLKPTRPAQLEGDTPLPDEGMLFLGDRGSLLCGFTAGQPRLLDPLARQAFRKPPKTLPRSPGNDREWIEACRGSKTPPAANFGFSATVTEALLLGNLAARTGEHLRWDSAKFELGGSAAAQALVHPPARPGWEL